MHQISVPKSYYGNMINVCKVNLNGIEMDILRSLEIETPLAKLPYDVNLQRITTAWRKIKLLISSGSFQTKLFSAVIINIYI